IRQKKPGSSWNVQARFTDAPKNGPTQFARPISSTATETRAVSAGLSGGGSNSASTSGSVRKVAETVRLSRNAGAACAASIRLIWSGVFTNRVRMVASVRVLTRFYGCGEHPGGVCRSFPAAWERQHLRNTLQQPVLE